MGAVYAIAGLVFVYWLFTRPAQVTTTETEMLKYAESVSSAVSRRNFSRVEKLIQKWMEDPISAGRETPNLFDNFKSDLLERPFPIEGEHPVSNYVLKQLREGDPILNTFVCRCWVTAVLKSIN